MKSFHVTQVKTVVAAHLKALSNKEVIVEGKTVNEAFLNAMATLFNGSCVKQVKAELTLVSTKTKKTHIQTVTRKKLQVPTQTGFKYMHYIGDSPQI